VGSTPVLDMSLEYDCSKQGSELDQLSLGSSRPSSCTLTDPNDLELSSNHCKASCNPTLDSDSDTCFTHDGGCAVQAPLFGPDVHSCEERRAAATLCHPGPSLQMRSHRPPLTTNGLLGAPRRASARSWRLSLLACVWQPHPKHISSLGEPG
jgi:hypothetical protein